MAAPAPAPVARPLLRAVDAAPLPHDVTTRAASLGVQVDVPLSNGRLAVDLPSYTVLLDGAPLPLSARQVELLALFLAAPRRVWSREELHWVCWGDTTPSRRADIQLCRLRGATGLELFRNVRDRGWALRPL